MVRAVAGSPLVNICATHLIMANSSDSEGMRGSQRPCAQVGGGWRGGRGGPGPVPVRCGALCFPGRCRRAPRRPQSRARVGERPQRELPSPRDRPRRGGGGVCAESSGLRPPGRGLPCNGTDTALRTVFSGCDWIAKGMRVSAGVEDRAVPESRE